MKKYWLDFGENRPFIEQLPGHIRQRVKRAVLALASEPRPPEAKAMDGELVGLYRIRVDQYRIIYSIHEETITIVIVRVAKRDNATYKGLPEIE